MQFALTVPTFEDKLAQRATVMVLEAVYEQDFLPCSYGFRPGRSAHQALQSLYTAVMSQGLRWVIDIDIVKYFDSIPHCHLRDFLDRRVKWPASRTATLILPFEACLGGPSASGDRPLESDRG